MNSLRKNLGYYVSCSGLYFFTSKNRITAEICLLMVLYRFDFPGTLKKLESMFKGVPVFVPRL